MDSYPYEEPYLVTLTQNGKVLDAEEVDAVSPAHALSLSGFDRELRDTTVCVRMNWHMIDVTSPEQ